MVVGVERVCLCGCVWVLATSMMGCLLAFWLINTTRSSVALLIDMKLGKVLPSPRAAPGLELPVQRDLHRQQGLGPCDSGKASNTVTACAPAAQAGLLVHSWQLHKHDITALQQDQGTHSRQSDSNCCTHRGLWCLWAWK